MSDKLGRYFGVWVWATLVAVVGTVVMGGIVRVTDSGLGCPDWPLCYGQIIPPWELSAWIEYTHRLSASLVGMFTLIMTISGIAKYGWGSGVLKLVLFVLVLVLVQGAFGAMTVLSEISPSIALIHTGIAMAIIGVLSVLISVRVSILPSNLDGNSVKGVQALKWKLVLLSALAYLVILSGAYVTRSGASLACSGVVLCGTPIAEMGHLHWVLMFHRLLVFGLFIWTINVIMKVASTHIWYLLSTLGYLVILLLTIQVVLGIGNVIFGLPGELRVLHLAFASWFFATSVYLTGRIWVYRTD